MELVRAFRPKSFKDIIGHEEIIKSLQDCINNRFVTNIMFIGAPGVGKTAMAEAMSHELFGSSKINSFVDLNSSDDRGIKVVRNQIKPASKQVGDKIILLDEFDNMTNDAQQALKRVIETKAKGIWFILTANSTNNIEPAIMSRFAVYHFKKLPKNDIAKLFVKVLKEEKIIIEEEHLPLIRSIVDKCGGDARKGLNILAQYINSDGTIREEDIKVSLGSIENCLKLAFEGNGEDAILAMENAYLEANENYEDIIHYIRNIIPTIELDIDIKMRMYTALSDTLHKCKFSDPITHLISFVSFCWVAKHLPKRYPIAGEKI